MSTNKKRVPYSKAELDESRKEKNYDSIETKAITEELKQAVTSGVELNYAETEFICSHLLWEKVKNPKTPVDYEKETGCEDYVFKILYISYYDDLEGKFAIETFLTKYRSEANVSSQQKQADVARLTKFAQEWKPVISKFNHKNNELLNVVASESNDQYKLLKSDIEQGKIDYREVPTVDKAHILNSKYVYLTAKEFFEEHKSNVVPIKFHSTQIEITPLSLVHILMRHYAKGAKQFDTKKSFHQDKSILWKTLPYDLKNILEKIGAHPSTSALVTNYFPIKYGNQIYAIYTETANRSEKGKQTGYTRLKTFYPLEDADKLNELKNDFHEVNIETGISIFVKN